HGWRTRHRPGRGEMIAVPARDIGLRCAGGERVGLGVEHLYKAVDAAGAQDRGKFRAARRQFADRPVQIDVGDLPAAAILAHQIIDVHRLAIRLDDLAGDDRAAGRGLFAGDLHLLARIVVEALGVNRRDITLESLRDLLALRLGQVRPFRANREAGHEGYVEHPADHWLDPGVAAGCTE